jgi:ribosome-associated protein
MKIPNSEIHFSYSRSSGAGGQNIQKVNTKATLHFYWSTSTLMNEEARLRFAEKYKNFINNENLCVIISQNHRTQEANAKECLAKLIKMISLANTKPKIRKKTKPTKSSIHKRLQNKKLHGEKKKGRKNPA